MHRDEDGTIPTDPTRILPRAHELVKAGQYANAKLHLEEFLKREPGHADALNLLGVVHLRTDHCVEALDLFQRSAAADADESYVPLFNSGLAMEKLGKPERAVEFFKKALQVISDLPYGLRGIDPMTSHCYDAIEKFEKEK